MVSRNPKRIFVYGTMRNLRMLKKRWGLEPQKIEKAYVHGRLYNCGWFPLAVVDDSEPLKIYGKLLQINDLNERFQEVDAYASCYDQEPGSMFFRVVTNVITTDDKKKCAWIYVGNLNNPWVRRKCIESNLIESGKWRY